MLIDTLCSVALYCQRCGKVQLLDVPLFSGRQRQELRCGACGERMGETILRPKAGLGLTIHCGVCGGTSHQQYSWHQLKRLRFEKLYCHHDHFELGYIGRWQDIAEFLDFNDAEYDSMHPGDGDRFLERQQILLEGLTRVHELAAHGDLSCPCGSQEVSAGLTGESIVLQCYDCGSSCVLPVRSAEDLNHLMQALGASWRLQSRL